MLYNLVSTISFNETKKTTSNWIGQLRNRMALKEIVIPILGKSIREGTLRL